LSRIFSPKYSYQLLNLFHGLWMSVQIGGMKQDMTEREQSKLVHICLFKNESEREAYIISCLHCRESGYRHSCGATPDSLLTVNNSNKVLSIWDSYSKGLCIKSYRQKHTEPESIPGLRS
jgi:hypothetical protein